MTVLHSLFVFLCFTTTAHSLTVVSDLDDTIKITRVKRFQAIKNSILEKDVFLGMDELVRAFKSNSDNKVYLVSGSMDLLKSPVNELLYKNDMIVDDIFLVGGSSKKPEVLNKLIEGVEDDVILIGDDQEHDPNFYENIQQTFPDKVKGIYIHQLNKVTLPKGQIGYFTAYEVAAHEHAAGRLSLESVEAIKNYIIKSLYFKSNLVPVISKKVSKKLIPDWQECNLQSVNSVLSKTRALKFADQKFLNLVSKIALKNCDD